MLKFFDATEAKEFGKTLANYYMEHIPLEPSKKKLGVKWKKEEIIVRLMQQAVEYNQKNRLNFYKKSQMGNSFKWALLDAGYERAFIDELTIQLMLKLR